MNNVSRIAVVIAVAAAAVSSSAFAQSSDQSLGLRVHHVRHHKMAPRQGTRAFALVPSVQGGPAFDPALTGAGSRGYNENLHRDQW